jgi:DNA-binding CsgD family transcriptional regulator/tetratricopeptide (TPR) repeat protein
MTLLERDSLLAELEAERKLAAAGRGRLVLLSGEAGAGKSSLAEAFGHKACAAVLWGSCDAMHTASPLGPLHDIAAAGGPVGGLLAAEAPRHRIFAALLEQLAAAQAPIVVLEDLHWADEATLDLVVYLARRIGNTRAMVLATFRDEPGPLRRVLGVVAAAAGVRRLEVPPLSRAAVGQLAAAQEVDADTLYDLTGGNPFFVTEVLAAQGAAIPVTVRDAVLARVESLTPQARRVLDAAAAVPGHVEVALLRAVGDAPDAAIDECEQSGVLRGDGHRLAFRHELSRIAIENATPVAARAAIHRRVLDYLAVQAGADPSRLAYHAERAGEGQAVLAHAIEAARRAVRFGAHREAVAQYERALRFSDHMTTRGRAEVLADYAVECRGTNRIADGIEAAAQALRIWRELGEAEREGELLARHALMLWSAGRNEEAHQACAEAVERVSELPPGPGLAAALTYRAYLRMLARDIPGALEWGKQAIELAASLGQQRLLSLALNAVGTAQWFVAPQEAAGTLGRSLGVARQCGDDESTTAALINLGSGAGEVREYAVAQRWLQETFAWCTDRGLETNRAYAQSWIARVAFERGQWATATRESAQAAHPASGNVPARIVGLTVVGRLRTRRGDPGPEASFAEAWELAQRTGDLQRLWPVAAGRAELAWLSGRPGEIAAIVEPILQLAVRLGHSWAIGELGYWLWRTGSVDRPPAGAAQPYALQMTGETKRAAQAWSDLGCPYEAAAALAESDAPEDLLSAYEQLDRLGAWPAAEAAARRLRESGVRKLPRRPRRATLANPGRLTGRELEVLQLLAQDLRNADVAARLHISAKTVDHHVSAILGKLGVTSRHEAVRLLQTQYGEAGSET